MTPKKCMSMAKSLTNTQHMEVEPLCSVSKVLLSFRFFSPKNHNLTICTFLNRNYKGNAMTFAEGINKSTQRVESSLFQR